MRWLPDSFTGAPSAFDSLHLSRRTGRERRIQSFNRGSLCVGSRLKQAGIPAHRTRHCGQCGYCCRCALQDPNAGERIPTAYDSRLDSRHSCHSSGLNRSASDLRPVASRDRGATLYTAPPYQHVQPAYSFGSIPRLHLPLPSPRPRVQEQQGMTRAWRGAPSLNSMALSFTTLRRYRAPHGAKKHVQTQVHLVSFPYFQLGRSRLCPCTGDVVRR